MGDKSELKRQLIIKKARKVFASRGFKNVTMKDIVDACEISRGGLYLHFDSTKEIFEAVMNNQDDADEEDVFSKAMKEHASSSDILALFLQEQKKELCYPDEDNLTVAIYEYYFENKFDTKMHPLKKQFDAVVLIIEQLIIDGVEAGEFKCADPKGAARNMMYVFEGLKVMSQTVGITEKAVNKEILYLMRNLLDEGQE